MNNTNAFSLSEFSQNPYARYAFFREHMPVYEHQLADGETIYFLSRYEDVANAMQDKRLSKVNPNEESREEILKKYPFVSRFNRRIQDLDPPDHTRLRKLVSDVFTVRGLKSIETFTRKTTVDLLNDLDRDADIDWVEAFAVPLPIIIISNILGFPAKDFQQIAQWSHAMAPLLDGGLGPEVALGFKAFEEVSEYLEDLVAIKRRNLSDDLISLLITSQQNEHQLTGNEIFSMVEIIMNAAHMTTSNLLANGLYMLLKHPQYYQRLTYDREILPSAIEEMLRMEAPVQAIDYYAREDIVLHNTRIPKNSRIALLVGSANRDESVFESPDIFNISRQPNKHLSFGGGIHFCLGAQLARLEAKIAFDIVLTRYPRMRIADEKVMFREGYNLRGLSSLPVILNG